MRNANTSSPLRKSLLTAHVATSVSVLGTDLVLLVLGISSVGGADPLTIYPAADLIATWLLAPLAVLALGTGVLLGLITHWGLFRYWWVTIKLILTAILTGVVLVPRLSAAAAAATGPSVQTIAVAERVPIIRGTLGEHPVPGRAGDPACRARRSPMTLTQIGRSPETPSMIASRVAQ